MGKDLKQEMASAIADFEKSVVEIDRNITEAKDGVRKLDAGMTSLETKIKDSIAQGQKILEP